MQAGFGDNSRPSNKFALYIDNNSEVEKHHISDQSVAPASFSPSTLH